MMCYILFTFIFILHVAEVSTSPERPDEREDVMGTYFLMNRYQCERLCWYRKLCKTYSYIYNRTLATGGNCVLHADNISTNTSGVSTAWIEREGFWDRTLQYNGCRNRSCSDTQVCVPTFDSPFYTCLPFVAECQAPSRDDGVYSNVTLLQGQRTNFTCNSSLVWAPRHADKTVTCQVTGKYSELKGTCKNAIYYSPSVPFNKPLPDVVAEGWEACIKGHFTTIGPLLTRMVFNFQDDQTGSCDLFGADGGNIYLSLDFRNEFSEIQHKVMWFRTSNNCQWFIPQNTVGDLPLNRGDNFEITLRILTNNMMEIIFKNLTILQFDLTSNNVNLTGATYLEIIRDVTLSYVDLGRSCD